MLDEEKEALIGATIVVKGTNIGTISDVNGNFQFEVPSDAKMLVVSYIGYLRKEVEIKEGQLGIFLELNVKELDELVVTGFAGAVGQARRRAASVQKIPESVFTLTSEQIEASGVTNIQSFASQIPNVSFQTSQNVGVNFINVRGIAQIRNGESPVAFVVDGVNIPDANLINQELYDLAMMEVVKGPQGTLYGKNAIGGAINILTQTPTNYFKNKISLGYGNGNSFRAQASSSGPLVKDKIYYRISGSYKSSDGVIENTTLGEPVDFLNDLSLRGQLKFDLSARFSATLGFQYMDVEGGATYYAHSPDGLQLAANDFDNVIDADQRGVSTLDNTFAFLKLEYNLGSSVLRSVTSINNAQRNHVGDLDFLSADILRQAQDSDSETFNQEIRLSSLDSDSKISWDLGVFYQNSDKLLVSEATADFGFFAMPPAPTGEQATLALLSDFNNNFRTLAFFGFLDYKLTDKFTASVGLRFDNDNITQDNRLLDTNPEKSQSELQPKLSLAYQATDNVLVYSNYGRGYRSGGFNSDATELFDAEYEGETSNNFEIGLKTASKDQRFIFNAAAFYVDFNNQQQYAVAIGSGGLVLGNYNFPETRVYGVEADLKYRTSKYLDIIAGFGFNESEIREGGTNGTIDRSSFVGNTTPFVPQTTFNLALQSGFALSENIDFMGFVNLSNKGRIYWHEDNVDVAD
ncbi:MAG: TonB-dependent receptor, partial [Bacteroidota bacterium]